MAFLQIHAEQEPRPFDGFVDGRKNILRSSVKFRLVDEGRRLGAIVVHSSGDSYNGTTMSYVPALLQCNRSSAAICADLFRELEAVGPYSVQEKKTSIHITNGRGAFLGLHPRKQGLRLNIVLAKALEGPKIAKSERVSANRYHNEVDVKERSDLDAELLGWIAEAYQR